MQDFTLVIPTYNRPNQLAALLAFLHAQQPSCRIMVLDSSQPGPRAETRKVVEAAHLKLDYVEFRASAPFREVSRRVAHRHDRILCAPTTTWSCLTGPTRRIR
jgi:GT2 family glycosyltransferase